MSTVTCQQSYLPRLALVGPALTCNGTNSQASVEGDRVECTLYGVGLLENHHSGEGEEDDTEDGGYPWRYNPGGKDLRNARPAPVDVVDANGCGRSAGDAADDGMRRRDGHAVSRSEGEEYGRADDGAHHDEEEHLWVALVVLGLDDLGADCVGHTGADGYAACKLTDSCQCHGLLQGQRPRRDRRRERVGDIVGPYRSRGGVSFRRIQDKSLWACSRRFETRVAYQCSTHQGR